MGSSRRAFNRRRRPARVTNLHEWKHFYSTGWHTQAEKGESTSCRGTVQSAWQKPPMRRKGGRAGLPVWAGGRHVVRGTDSPHLSWKCAKVTGKAGENGQNSGNRAAVLTLDKTVGSQVWRHTPGSSKRPALDLGWGSSSKTAPRSLSTGSPADRTPLHGDGSMYSQTNVGTEKGVCRKQMGPSEELRLRSKKLDGWEGDPGVRLGTEPSSR